jgi:hypothetical protein
MTSALAKRKVLGLTESGKTFHKGLLQAKGTIPRVLYLHVIVILNALFGRGKGRLLGKFQIERIPIQKEIS